MIRPEALAGLHRWHEVIAALALAALGLWLVWLGGALLIPLGALALVAGLVLARLARRRMRFAQGGAAPGVVEIDEGQIGYFGPVAGGHVSLADLVELRLLHLRGQRLWRLKQADGQVLLIPVAASGAERLFDAFAGLPGLDMASVLRALDDMPAAGPPRLADGDATMVGPVIWRRAARAALT